MEKVKKIKPAEKTMWCCITNIQPLGSEKLLFKAGKCYPQVSGLNEPLAVLDEFKKTVIIEDSKEYFVNTNDKTKVSPLKAAPIFIF